MKILAIADVESKLYYDYYRPELLEGIDMIIACGDLHRDYLEFLVTMARCPVYYVCGNHDETYVYHPPEGCICIDDQIVTYKGIRLMGLGGCKKYNDHSTYMYTEREMKWRILKLWFQLLKNKGFDILVTHAAPYGCGDMEDYPHQGFECFLGLMEKYKPKFLIHGHVHQNYGMKIPRRMVYQETTVVNAYEYHIIELDDAL